MSEEPAPVGRLDTPFGPVNYKVSDSDAVVLEGPSILFNRVPYYLVLPMVRSEDGRWGTPVNVSMFLDRQDQTGGDATRAVAREVFTVISEWWAEYISHHPEILRRGEIHALTRRLIGVEDDIRNLSKQSREAEEIRENILHSLKELGHFGPHKQDWTSR